MRKFFNFIRVPYEVEIYSRDDSDKVSRKYFASLRGKDRMFPPTSKSRVIAPRKIVLDACCRCGRKRRNMKNMKGWIPCQDGVICSACLRKSLYKG
jgi:hypothetical protein